jgi:glucokinase
MILAGDVGGTKTVLGVYSPERGPRDPLVEETFLSSAHRSLEDLAGPFLSKLDVAVDRACFGVAGAVVEGRAEGTNLPWLMDEKDLADALGISAVKLMNDLEAVAFAVPVLDHADVYVLNEAQREPRGAIGVIAPGTGLGEAFLAWDGNRYRAYPSEGGHCDFAPTTPLELEMLRYLLDRYDHVSYERVCSGRGMPNIYDFLRDTGRGVEPDWLAVELAEAEDPTPVFVNAALERKPPCELCVATLDVFVSILGSEAGNLALKVLATGGVYLGGGIPPRILSALRQGSFMRSFCNKGRLSYLTTDIPVSVILNPKAALLGAACCGLNL